MARVSVKGSQAPTSNDNNNNNNNHNNNNNRNQRCWAKDGSTDEWPGCQLKGPTSNDNNNNNNNNNNDNRNQRCWAKDGSTDEWPRCQLKGPRQPRRSWVEPRWAAPQSPLESRRGSGCEVQTIGRAGRTSVLVRGCSRRWRRGWMGGGGLFMGLRRWGDQVAGFTP